MSISCRVTIILCRGKKVFRCYQSPRKNVQVLPQFGRMFVCMCVWIHEIIATPFNLQLRNFGIKFIIRLSKICFLKYVKNCFLQSNFTFSIFLKNFLVILKNNYAKTNLDRNVYFGNIEICHLYTSLLLKKHKVLQ